MKDAGATIFPAGTPVLIIGFTDKGWDHLEAFAYGRACRAKVMECGKLAEPLHAGSAGLLLKQDGGVAGIKPMPEDRIMLLESRSQERMVSIERRTLDEHGIARYLVIEDRKGFVRDLSAARGFMSGYEVRARVENQVEDEFKRILSDLHARPR